ncbi:protein FAM89A-like [Lethenteron reissneri]|uniref:protein FAM89A-like n=1 Tax=Lethenteron reissneri TaxID=7753 RepID=UPI002AB7746B|nr:protein FAM89A-like [Lethenteron reissneri]
MEGHETVKTDASAPRDAVDSSSGKVQIPSLLVGTTPLAGGRGTAAPSTVGPSGLPALPKSLSGLLSSAGGGFGSHGSGPTSWRELERTYAKRSMIQDDLQRGRSGAAEGRMLLASCKPGNLDLAMALLRKEMMGLRQLDMSLLCQLSALNEGMQEYKTLVQDLSMASSVTPSETSFEDDYDGEFSPRSGSYAVGSSRLNEPFQMTI